MKRCELEYLIGNGRNGFIFLSLIDKCKPFSLNPLQSHRQRRSAGKKTKIKPSVCKMDLAIIYVSQLPFTPRSQ